MADSPEPPFRNTSKAAPPPRLRYPTHPPLSASVEEWLSRSHPTSMTSARHTTSHSSNSLSESWATLSVSDDHSEDGTRSEQTDVGSLIDHSGPDDVASLDERYSSSEVDGNEHDEQSNASESQELPTLFPQVGDAINNSNLTTKTAFHHSTDSIEFIEPEKWPEVERVELKHTIRVLEGAEASALKERLPYNLNDYFLMATIQQTMTKQSLDLDKPFRVLYIGNAEFRNIILDKIGDVLVSSSCSSFECSSTESSRYHVVPTSFGAGAVPNFAELLPIHVQLVVDECLDATEEPQADKPSTMTLQFKNRPPCTSLWTGSDYCVSSATDWTLPDVAILFVSNTDDENAVRTQRLARAFIQRHGIPTMVISQEPLWKMTTELIPVNPHSLHMCLESRRSLGEKGVVVRRYPIDLKTFESITPGQLNRNLASLASLYPKRAYKVTGESRTSSDRTESFDTEKYPKNIKFFPSSSRAQELAPALRMVTLTIISAVAVCLGLTVLNAAVVLISQFIARSGISDIMFPSWGSIPTSSVIPPGGLRQISPSLKSSAAVNLQLPSTQDKDRSKAEELMGISLQPREAQEKPNSFEIQVVGDCHVVIKSPRGVASVKKQPSFNVSVKRHDNVLSYELSKLFDGVYTLKLDREEAYGLINVTITTRLKPPFEQIAQLDFGTPWLKIANWKRAAHGVSSKLVRDWNTAQTGISEVYGRFCTDLQVLMGDVVKRSHFLRREAGSLGRESVQLTLGTRDVALSRSKQLSQVVKRTAVQQFQAASSVWQGSSKRANKEAKELMSDTWKRLSKSAQKVDLQLLMNRLQNLKKSRILDKAQMQARSLLQRTSSQQPECPLRPEGRSTEK